MKQMAVLMLGLTLVMTSSGCYCWSPLSGGIGTPYGGYGAYGLPRGSGGYGVTQPGTVVPNGTFTPQSYYGNPEMNQVGIPVVSPIAVAPLPAYPMMAFGPMETLPTY